MTMGINKNITDPAYASLNWNVPLNANFDNIDAGFGGVQTYSLTGVSGIVGVTGGIYVGAYPANTPSYVPVTHILSGAMSGNVTLQFLTGVGGIWNIQNTATGHTLTIASGGGGTTVTIPTSINRLVVSDGTNIAFADTLTFGAAGSNSQVQYNSGGNFAGSPNFVFDGSNINVTGFISSSSSGFSFPDGTIQITAATRLLAAPLTLYVATTGSDANNGLTSGTPFQTLQHAWNVLAGQYNLNGNTATIQLADGTYGGALLASAMPAGALTTSSVVINGHVGSPSSVTISTTSSNCISASGPCGFLVQNVTLTNSGGANNSLAAANGATLIFTNVIFGASSNAQIAADYCGSVLGFGNYSVTAGAASHVSSVSAASININNTTVTITGTPAFSTAFAIASAGATVSCTGVTFTGSATGSRYQSTLCGSIYTGTSGGATYLPGNSGGTTSNNGVYY